MAGQNMTSKATLKADNRDFVKKVKQSGGAMEELQRTSGRVSGAISAAMAFSTGFGMIQAISQARAMMQGLADERSDFMRRVSLGAGGGERAQSLRAQAQQIRAKANDPFRGVAGAGKLAASAVNTLFQGALNFGGGNQDGKDEAVEQLKRIFQQLKDDANITRQNADTLDRLAAAFEEQGRDLKAAIESRRGAAGRVGLGDAFMGLLEAMNQDGISDAEAATARALIRELAARQREKARYDTSIIGGR